MNKVVVPREDLDKVEEARKALFNILKDALERDPSLIIALQEVTDPIWRVAHRRWPAASDRDELVEALSVYILADIRKRFPDDSPDYQDDLLWDPDIWRHGIFSDAQLKASKRLLADAKEEKVDTEGN